MNYFSRASAFLFTIVSVALIGCGRGSEKSEAKAPNRKDLPSFKAGKGLFLPEETRRAIGLEIADIVERKLDRSVTVEVQVYQSTTGKLCYASGLVGQEQSGWLRPGQAVSLASTDGKTVPGRLVRLDSHLQPVPSQTELIIEILVAGMRPVGKFLTATASETNAEQVTTVPVSALLRAAAGDFVYVVNGERLLRTAITVGTEADGFVQIKDGLYAGDKVVVKPAQTLWLTELRLATASGDTD